MLKSRVKLWQWWELSEKWRWDDKSVWQGDGVKGDPRGGEGEEAHVNFNGTSKGEQWKVYTRI